MALDRGLNYWNWCGHQDGMAEAIGELGSQRKRVVITAQLWARDEQGVQTELEQVLDRLKVDCLDVVLLRMGTFPFEGHICNGGTNHRSSMDDL